MNDLDFIRLNHEKFDFAMESRGLERYSSKILLLDAQRKQNVTYLQKLQQEAKNMAKKIGALKQSKSDSSELELKAKTLFETIETLKKSFDSDELKLLMDSIPNIPDDSVPLGKGESDNVEILRYGSPRNFDFLPSSHHDLGEKLNIIDFSNTVAMCGSRFSSLKGKLAKLSRVLINFMLDNHINNYGYQEVFLPFLVRDKAMYNVGQLPKFAEESFVTTNGLRLIPTAEVTLMNFIVDNKAIPLADLPIRLTAYSECFRMEAGSAGKDLKGILRQHQFSKVELVSVVAEENSADELENMVNVAESILQKLEIPYRRVLLCSGDLGFAAAKTYDIEVWIPSQNVYREISSCSNCKAFQARRMGAKYVTNNGKRFVHTLNGSALSIGRTLIAIMENYQNRDGSITIPDILKADCGFESIS